MLTSDSPSASLGDNVPKQAEQASTLSSAAPESTTADLAKQVPLEKKGNLPGSFPETPSKEPEQFSVNPIPASKGASNPVKLQPGEKVPDPSTTHANTVQSTARTDPEGYEKDASASLAGLAGTSNPASVSGPSSGRRQSKIIPESGLPVGGASVGLTDTGVTIESAAPEATTAGLAAGVPLESQKKQTNGGGSAVNEVPGVVRNSISEAHKDPEAAASKEAVGEKKEFEDELQKKVKVDESGGTPGPTDSAVLTETAPVAAGTTSHSTQLSPRSTPPPEPTVTTGVASSRTPGVSGSKGASSEEAAGSKATEESARKTSDPQGHSGLTGPPQNKNSGTSDPQTEAAESKPAETSANGNGHGNDTVRKDFGEKAKEQASDVAKEQKKKHRGSGFFQKLKEKLKWMLP